MKRWHKYTLIGAAVAAFLSLPVLHGSWSHYAVAVDEEGLRRSEISGSPIALSDDVPLYMWRVGNPTRGLAFKTRDGEEIGRMCFDPTGESWQMRTGQECTNQ